MSREFKVGLIVLVSGLLLYYGFNYLKGIDFFSPTNKYYVIYENVDGLNKSNPVIINGLTVGRVSRIKLLQESNENEILVEIDIDESITLGDSTVASLTNTDFLGSKGIVLTVGPLANPIEPGDTLISMVDKGLNEILASAEPVATNLNTTITRVNEILIGLKGSGEKINKSIDKILITLDQVNGMMANNQENISKTITSFNELAITSKRQIQIAGKTAASADSLLQNLNSIETEKINKELLASLEEMNRLLDKLNSEEGTLGKLMTDDSLYTNLNQTLIDLDKLLIHINEYPKHYVAPFGKSHKKVMRDLNKKD